MTAAPRTSLPGLLAARAAETPNAVALTFHDLGIWNPVSWAELADRVAHAANVLAQSGVGRSEVVALIGDNRPEWIVADLAIQAVGAVSLPLRPDFSPERMATLCRQHEARHFIVGDQQQFDKIVPVLEQGTLVHTTPMVLIFEPRGISGTELDATRALIWEKALASTSAGRLGDRTDQLTDHTICTHTVVIENSGDGLVTVEVTQESAGSLVAAAISLKSSLDIHAGDQLYPFANLADPTERSLCEVLGLLVGSIVNLGEGGLLTTLESRSVQPTIAHVPAAELNRMHSDIVAKRAKRGIRRLAVNRVLRGARGEVSRASLPDLVVTYSLGAAWVVTSLIVHSAFRSINGGIRLGIIATLGTVVLAVLVLGGYGVRPFLRKAYGLSRARFLLTGPGVSPDTTKLLSGLKLSPVRERLAHMDVTDSSTTTSAEKTNVTTENQS